MEPRFEPRTAGLSLFPLLSFDRDLVLDWREKEHRHTRRNRRSSSHHNKARLAIKRVVILLLVEGL